jgi:hypothetical protein
MQYTIAPGELKKPGVKLMNEAVKKQSRDDEGRALATYSIPEAGAMVGLSRGGSYDAAKRKEIPVLEFGRRKVVPKALWHQKLGIG